MENEEKQVAEKFTDLIANGFEGDPFSPEDSVEFTWDMEKDTHNVVLSVIRSSLWGEMINSPFSDEGKYGIEAIYDQIKTLKKNVDNRGVRFIGTIKCEFASVMCLLSLILMLYDNGITDQQNNDVLPDKKGLIEFCDGLFSKIKRV